MKKDFDPNAAATSDSGIFGLPFTEKEASLVYLPVPWEVTTSYGDGTSKAPEAILEASHQMDLFDLEVEKPYEAGLHMRSVSKQVLSWNAKGKALAKNKKTAKSKKTIEEINLLSNRLNTWVREECEGIERSGKIVGLIGGDHSAPFGAIQAAAKREKEFGVLHLDAHHDLRKAYQGFTYSHASIMYNVLQSIPQVAKLTQVGIRDFCEEEFDCAEAQGNRVSVFYDLDLAKERARGESWIKQSRKIIDTLPEKVWVSFDIDGLDPQFCPSTGTPVPGGMSFHESILLLGELARSGRKIIGFDLNEVGAEEWDANVGMRILYKLSAYTLASQKKASWIK